VPIAIAAGVVPIAIAAGVVPIAVAVGMLAMPCSIVVNFYLDANASMPFESLESQGASAGMQKNAAHQFADSGGNPGLVNRAEPDTPGNIAGSNAGNHKIQLSLNRDYLT
jgi:hypothetical protein